MVIESEKVRQYIRSLEIQLNPLAQRLTREVPPDAVDLLGKLLAFNPRKRPSAEVGICNGFIACFHNSCMISWLWMGGEK